MKQNAKSITKQLTIGAFILTSVTVMSVGIRQVRFSSYRTDFSGPAPPAGHPDIEGKPIPDKKLVAKSDTDYYPEDSYKVEAEPDPEYTDEPDWNKQAPSEDYADTNIHSDESGKTLSKTKSVMDSDTKAKASKSLEKISLSDYEELYFSKEGEFWYVSKEPDGSTTKMQVHIDDDTGKFTVVDGGYYTKQEPHRIQMSNNEDIYLTEEGQAWYVSEQSDGSTTKIQLQPN